VAAAASVLDAVDEEGTVGKAPEGIVECLTLELIHESTGCGDVLGQGHDRGATFEGEPLHCDFHIDDATTLEAVLPLPDRMRSRARTVDADPLHHRRNVLGGPDVGDAHGEELLARVSAEARRGVVDLEKGQRLEVPDELRVRIAGEEQAKTLFLRRTADHPRRAQPPPDNCEQCYQANSM